MLAAHSNHSSCFDEAWATMGDHGSHADLIAKTALMTFPARSDLALTSP